MSKTELALESKRRSYPSLPFISDSRISSVKSRSDLSSVQSSLSPNGLAALKALFGVLTLSRMPQVVTKATPPYAFSEMPLPRERHASVLRRGMCG